MSEIVAERGISTAPAPIASPGELLPYAVFAGFVLFVLIYFVGAEEGVASLVSGTSVHEFVHDGRHLLGFPCH
ncbi:MAG: CbtB domain-containing protein [Solirubrobacteraceae bacterium]